MTDKELKRLGRSDLLEMLLELSKENEQLRQESQKLREELADRTLQIENTGSLAEAALQLNGVFQAAQEACNQYKWNSTQRIDALEQQTREACEAMLAQAREQAQQILDAARKGQALEEQNGDSQ